MMNHNRNNRMNSFMLFFIGAFSMTQIHFIGNIGISEICCLFAFPLVLLKETLAIKKNGIRTVLILLVLTILGCCIGSWKNGSRMFDFLRGVASPIVMFANIVVLHSLLRKNLNGYKWLLLGLAITNFLNIYAFQTGQSGDGAVNGEYGDAVEITTSNALFWVTRLRALLTIPIQSWYLETPILYSIMAPIGVAVYAILTTASGRSSFVITLATGILILIGRKRVATMSLIRRNFFAFLICVVLSVFLMKTAYQYLAVNGSLGEKARVKYEAQTKGKSGVLALLMGGRSEFFVGLFAALDHPVIGVGPWALDTGGYREDFLLKYGNDEDIRIYTLQMINAQRSGISRRYSYLPSHSYIIGFWHWYGIFGLVFWLYVLYLIFMLFKRYIAVVPQWYGFYCVALPALFWNIFFSPFAGRTYAATCIVMMLLSRAIAQRRLPLPDEMLVEIK